MGLDCVSSTMVTLVGVVSVEWVVTAKVIRSLPGAGYRKIGKTSMLLRGFLTLEKLDKHEESFIERHYMPDIT